MQHLRWTHILCFLAAVSGCAGVKNKMEGSGGSGNTTGGGAGGSGGGSGTGATTGGGTGGGITGSGAGGACQQAAYTFVPKIPTVHLLVDRSGSMFTCLGSTSPDPCTTQTNSGWIRMRDSILQVVEPLQAQVRFGFSAFTGVVGMCNLVSGVPSALNNYEAIRTGYTGLAFRKPEEKWESPLRRALETVGGQLMADTSPGDKYILLVTDGEPDYCGDGNPLCAPESVAGELQILKAAGITTIVFGIQTTTVASLSPLTLQSWATAGAGEPTLAPLMNNGKIEDFFDQCFPGGDPAAAGWKADFLAKYPECVTNTNTCRGRTIGTYAAASGPTRPYTPDVNNQQALVNALSQALSGVKSCTFDLGNLDGKAIRVDLTQLAKANVLIENVAVPLDPANGWTMVTGTQLELTGSACADWRKPENKNIAFQFPCEIIVVP
jgi:hypothetical protein